MKKRIIKEILLFVMMLVLLCGCGQKKEESETYKVRVGSLKGPTTIGLLEMMHGDGNYEFTMAVNAEEITAKVLNGDLDIALVPANVAAVLYFKSEGKIQIIDVNTLGVLYMVGGDDEIYNMADLAGRTICLTGKGTGPDAVLQFLLAQNGLSVDKVQLEYKSEATEVVQYVTENPSAIAVLPQPFATAACKQNEDLNVIFDLTLEWEELFTHGESLVTGVTIASTDFIVNHPEELEQFLADHRESAAYCAEDVSQVAAWTVEQEIIGKEAIAQAAIPKCNITCVTGGKMKQMLSAYYEVLYRFNKALVGEAPYAPGDVCWNALYYGVTDE